MFFVLPFNRLQNKQEKGKKEKKTCWIFKHCKWQTFENSKY